jgi:hypothetical protein
VPPLTLPSTATKARVPTRPATDAPAAQTGTSGFGGATNSPLSLAIDTSASVNIDFKGTLASAADTITLQSYIIRVHRRTA